MSQKKYTLSFTTGAAFVAETVKIAELYSEMGDWSAVRTLVLNENTLQARTTSTLNKLYRAISSRLKTLSEDEISMLVTGHEDEQRQLIWLAICQRYSLIKDFAIEVLSDRYDKAQYHLSYDDYDVFYNRHAEWHSNLDQASQSTRSKARQVVFKMLRECCLINESNEILPQLLDDKLIALIKQNDPDNTRIFPGSSI